MPADAISVISRATTEDIAPAERVHFWEEYNRKALVGLSCRSYSDKGLLATQTNLRVGGVRLAHITGNAHVVERTPHLARSVPNDSVFASLLVKGDAVFYHQDGCLAAGTGDLVVYDTRNPYLFGFSSSMKQILVDIPGELFAETCVPGGVPVPMLFGRASAREGALVSALASLLGGLVGQRQGGEDPGDLQHAVLGLMRLLTLQRYGGPMSSLTQRIIAEEHIERHLHDPKLDAAAVAAVLGISVRQLSRIFEAAGTSPARYILERRLRRVHAELSRPGIRDTTIADVAYRWGFSSQAHFARVFRARFGHTPSEVRSAAAEPASP
ncbi:transcriptional regulator [Sphaerisporangium krabiense]|uniref:AraC-like DNA-binding protein n=1 Tax=Sphaerisporangium krabiense TaxID=763782 RepID=A0A7W9DPV8_9ACTN|nr:helix-turn-helix domain-containing protein [Sphaerisporangium krabiense]MBB5626902.1 AraC-like DNA-binding protein [Sphaerisporangium krabiense]GII66702.1 transcriptional regulator [Sphaerisporangium krabiense]